MVIHSRFERRYDAAIVERPSAGEPMYAFAAGDAGSRAITVMVEPWGATAWTAEFFGPDPGRRALSGLFGTPSPDCLCVIERGTAFFGDVRNPTGFAVVDTRGAVVNVKEVASSGLLLLLTPWAITALDARGTRWATERISIETIRIDEVTEGWAKGLSDPEDDELRSARRVSVLAWSGFPRFRGCGQ